MRVGIEISTLTNRRPAGIGRYAASLLTALAELQEAESLRLAGIYDSSRIKKSLRLRKFASSVPKRPWHRLWLGPWHYDVVHATGRWLPTAGSAAKIVTVHDLHALMGPEITTPDEVARQAGLHAAVARSADRIIFVSDATRRQFLEHFPRDENTTDVTHLGVHERFIRVHEPSRLDDIRSRYANGSPFVLFVGSLKPNKNLARLLLAYADSALLNHFPLVIAGHAKGSDPLGEIPQSVADRLRSRVMLANYVPDADLPALYAAASAFLFPSLNEGFGLPIIEAMASGTPVLTSRSGSCPEVAAGYAELVTAQDVDDIRRGLDAVVEMSAEQVESARRYAATKTWSATAQQTLAAYRRALK